VPAGEESLIWERFYRSERVTVQSGSGIGLGMGLHIARTIVERHGGEVGLKTRRGKGTTFWYALPLVDPPAAATMNGRPKRPHPRRP
jgi:signal transduction histidine kinase